MTIFEHHDIDGDQLTVGRTTSKADRDRGQNWFVKASPSGVLLDDEALRRLARSLFSEIASTEPPVLLPSDGFGGLTTEQKNRVEITKAVRGVLAQRGVVGSGSLDPYPVIALARYIEIGDDPSGTTEDDPEVD